MESGFAAKSLRELRLRAGLTQVELAKRSGVSSVTVCHIEQGRVKPQELTWRALLKALSNIGQDAPAAAPAQTGGGKEQFVEEKVRAFNFCGEVFERDEFFLKLRPKLGRSLAAFFNEFLIATFLKNAEFFSRQRYYPGDFATAVELLGTLLKAQRGPAASAGSEYNPLIARRRWQKRR